MPERRVWNRYPRRVPVDVTEGAHTAQATTRDLSLGGACIESGEPFAVGARVRVHLRLPHRTDPIEVGAEVRWLGADPETFGVRFDGLRAEEVWALVRFLES